ncbi:MAG TPA: hypothetical protein VE972_13095 [Conexibacter sp.]|nr:hypothetical protein [Conexibacter sp.]
MRSPVGTRRVAHALLLVALACAALCAPARAAARTSAVIALLPMDLNPSPPGVAPPAVDRLIDGHPELALGLLSATQSGYSPQQALLDLTAGTRSSRGTYHPHDPPDMFLLPTGRGGLTVNWAAALGRAGTAPANIVPGLLASSVPGGAGYAGIAGQPNLEAVAATDRDGHVAAVSLGSGDTLAARTATLLADHRLVVAALPPGYAGDRQLDALIAARAPGELLIAMQDPPPFQGPRLLWTGIAGLGASDAGFSSVTTRIPGIAAGIDVLPTVLGHLGIPVPESVRGEPIRVGGPRDADALRRLDDRLSVIVARRMPALQTFLFTWLGVILLAGILRDRAGVRWALRIGALAVMWLPALLLGTAALAPSEQAELFLLAGGSFALALATDRLLAWPRGPAAPTLTALLAYTLDLANHSHLVIRSLLGPSPRSGSRFYGLGNELEIVLTIVLLVAVAATLRRRERTRAGALAFALGGIALAAVAGSGRLGADVGAIFTIAAGAAVATLLMLPGGVTRRALVIALLTPVAGLVALALLDLATGGDGHFTRNVLHGSAGDQLNTLERRYELAWSFVRAGYAPLLIILCGLAVAYALRHRRRIYAAIETDVVWRACLGGGLAAAISGSLFNDSGPVLLFIGIVSLTFLTTYLRAAPLAEGTPGARGRGVAEPAAAVPPRAAEREPAAASPS